MAGAPAGNSSETEWRQSYSVATQGQRSEAGTGESAKGAESH